MQTKMVINKIYQVLNSDVSLKITFLGKGFSAFVAQNLSLFGQNMIKKTWLDLEVEHL